MLWQKSTIWFILFLMEDFLWKLNAMILKKKGSLRGKPIYDVSKAWETICKFQNGYNSCNKI